MPLRTQPSFNPRLGIDRPDQQTAAAWPSALLAAGSAGRGPVGFGGPPKPGSALFTPHPDPLPVKGRGNAHRRTVYPGRRCACPGLEYRRPVGAAIGSADWRPAVARIGNPHTVHCTCGVADRQLSTRRSLGSTGRWSVGFGDPPKPGSAVFTPHPDPLPVKGRGNAHRRTVYAGRHGACPGLRYRRPVGAAIGSADWRRAVPRIGNPQTVHCTCGVADRQLSTRRSLRSTGHWPVGFGGPPKSSPQLPASSFQLPTPNSWPHAPRPMRHAPCSSQGSAGRAVAWGGASSAAAVAGAAPGLCGNVGR